MISKRSQYATHVALQKQLEQELEETFERTSMIDSIDDTSAWTEQFIQSVQNYGYLPA